MRVDRRSFLGALASSMAAMAGKPVLRSSAADVFENDILRVRVPKPEGWRYLDTLEWALNWSDTKFESGEISDDELKEFARRPLFFMTTNEEDDTGVHANVSLWPDPDIPAGEELAEGHARFLPGVQRLFLDFDLLEGPASSSLGGAPASRLHFRYTAQSHSGGKRACEVQHYLLKRDELFIGINFAHAVQGHPEHVLKELWEIRDNMEFWD